jgi:hypothetical protein
MKKFLIKLGVLIFMLYPFMDTESKQVNRCYKRYNGAQIEEMILTLNHLMKPIV